MKGVDSGDPSRFAPNPPPVAAAKKGRIWPWILGLLLIGGLLFLVPDPQATSSSLSRASDGWLAMRAYLEARGVEVEILDAPLGTESGTEAGDSSSGAGAGGNGGEATDPGLLVITLPWQRLPDGDLEKNLRLHLRRGGDVLLAYDGGGESFAQEQLFESFGLKPVIELRGEAPLAPRAWWNYQKELFTLEPALATASPSGSLEIPAFRYAPNAPPDAEILYRLDSPGASQTTALAFEVKRHGGRLLVMPVKILANAHLAGDGHADFLESLVASFGDRPWLFDEYHHGLIRADLVESSAAAHAWDLFILHLALLYGLAVLAVGRRFGPTWREAKLHSGSTGEFLRSLGVLHHELGHHRDAARRLLERVLSLEPHLKEPLSPSERTPRGLDPDGVENAEDLLAFADRLAQIRQAGSPSAKG